MTFRRRVDRLLRRYGSEALVEWDDRSTRVKAMIQPLYYKNKMYLEGSYLPDGYYDGGHYLYIGPAGVRLDQLPFDAVVARDGVCYRIKRAELVKNAGEALYSWAILQICGEGSDESV
jgi:hypothetical protein